MNYSSIATALALGLVCTAAVAADVAPSATPPPAAASVQAASVTKPAPSAPAPVSKRVAAIGASQPAPDGVRKMFCLNMSMRCFAVSQATTSNDKAAPASSLDLHAPDIRRLVPEVSLREPLEDADEVHDQQEQVQVEGTRPEVEVPGGLMTLPWAVMHPTQAWRIFLPVPSAK